MGYMRHHAMGITSWDEEVIAKIHTAAERMFAIVSPIMSSQKNGYKTFFVPPDGSKEGWRESDEGDAARAAFIQLLRAEVYEDGSSCLDWFEVQYGDEDGDNRLLAANNR